MPFRFVHAADLHLDTPFSGIARADAGVAQALRDASLDAWDALVDLTLAERAAFLLLAGDIYDGPRRGLRAQVRFLQGVRRLGRAGVHVFAVHGNHDPFGAGWSAVDRWPEGMCFFPADRVGSEAVRHEGRLLATVHGVSFAQAAERRNLASLFARDGDGLQIGLLHCNVGGDTQHGDYAPCAVADLTAAGLDYWALGHVHRRTVVVGGEPCWAVYPGNLQGRSPAPGEAGAKGALVVECDEDRGIVAPPRFVPLDRARFVSLEIDATGSADAAGAVERVGDELERLRERPQHSGRGLVVRAVLRGELAAPWSPQPAETREWLEQVRARAAALAPFVWCDALDVRLQAPVSPEAVAGRGDFAADLVARCAELRDDRAELEALLARLDTELPAAVRTDVQAAEPAGGQPLALLAAAEQACLRLLLGPAGGSGRP